MTTTYPYIGLHEVNTGPSAAPVSTLPAKPSSAARGHEPFGAPALESQGDRHAVPGGREQAGQTEGDQQAPATTFQTCGSTPMRAVETLSRRVKATTESPSEAVTTSARVRAVEATEPPTTTGRTGRTHGASVVSTPATSAPDKGEHHASCAAMSAPETEPVHFFSASSRTRAGRRCAGR